MWSTLLPDQFTPRKETRYPSYRRKGGPQNLVRKISPSPGFDPRTVRPVASRYTDYVIPVTYVRCITGKHFRMIGNIQTSFTGQLQLSTEIPNKPNIETRIHAGHISLALSLFVYLYVVTLHDFQEMVHDLEIRFLRSTKYLSNHLVLLLTWW